MESKARVVHCRKEKYDIYIGRPSFWGNEFVIGVDGTREEVIEMYRNWLFTHPEGKKRLKRVPELRGKILGCYCAPLPCHGDILLELANKSK